MFKAIGYYKLERFQFTSVTQMKRAIKLYTNKSLLFYDIIVFWMLTFVVDFSQKYSNQMMRL